MRLEHKSDNSNKFWEPKKEGSAVTVCFGKIGTDGQKHTKKFTSSDKAESGYRKLVCKKLAKGYKPTGETVAELFQGAAPVEAPTVIGSLYIGDLELVADEVFQDICAWITACIQHGMTPKQFKNISNKFREEYWEGEFADSLCPIVESVCWCELADWSEGELHELYTKAVKNGGDRFIWYDDDGHTYIVALRGNPGVRAIEICVHTEKNCKDDNGQWFDNWPAELGPGAPITSISGDGATLLGGRKYSLSKKAFTNTVLDIDGVGCALEDADPRKRIAGLIVNTKSAITKFIVADHFKVNVFDDAPVKISYLRDDFKSWFLGNTEEMKDVAIPRVHHDLCRDSLDCEILSDLGGEAKAETTLAGVYGLLKLQPNCEAGILLTNGSSNIFYVRCGESVLRAVIVVWRVDGWYVDAYSVEDPRGWRAGDRVFSC